MTQRTVFITGSSSGLGPNLMGAVPFNSIYHATKWALEGWSESLAFGLNQLGIGMKTVCPGGMDQLRYVAGADARATYATRLEVGDEALRKAIRQRFFGAERQEGA